jgi:hypothetical protein
MMLLHQQRFHDMIVLSLPEGGKVPWCFYMKTERFHDVAALIQQGSMIISCINSACILHLRRFAQLLGLQFAEQDVYSCALPQASAVFGYVGPVERCVPTCWGVEPP